MIELDGVRKEYGDVVAVQDVSLSVGGGQFHCLIGPNGSGKTTLFRLLLGLARPTAGTLSVPDGAVGCGFQQPNFYPDLTVRENLTVFASLVGSPGREWRETVVDELRLRRAMDRPAHDLSGGFARKLDLALALLKRPDYLLLDEPLAALDDVSKERLLDFLSSYAGDATVLVSTHHVGDFEPHTDRLTVMHEGSVVLDARPENIDLDGHDSLQEYYVALVRERERAARSGSDGAGGRHPDPDDGQPDTGQRPRRE
ncbi:MAG: ABC transporter ATP-binding protein [Haloarculaceae archaeon]